MGKDQDSCMHMHVGAGCMHAQAVCLQANRASGTGTAVALDLKSVHGLAASRCICRKRRCCEAVVAVVLLISCKRATASQNGKPAE